MKLLVFPYAIFHGESEGTSLLRIKGRGFRQKQQRHVFLLRLFRYVCSLFNKL